MMSCALWAGVLLLVESGNVDDCTHAHEALLAWSDKKQFLYDLTSKQLYGPITVQARCGRPGGDSVIVYSPIKYSPIIVHPIIIGPIRLIVIGASLIGQAVYDPITNSLIILGPIGGGYYMAVQ